MRVGVTFASLQALKPYKNTVTIVPGRGATRINDAAPPNVMIYPVRSNHIVCEEYKSGYKRFRVEGEYDCFVDRYGEWVCGSSGAIKTKVTQLN